MDPVVFRSLKRVRTALFVDVDTIVFGRLQRLGAALLVNMNTIVFSRLERLRITSSQTVYNKRQYLEQ